MSSSTSGPTASRTAPTHATAASISRRQSVMCALPNGSHLSAFTTLETVYLAFSANCSGMRAPVNHAFAYIGTCSRIRPPSRLHTGAL